MTQFSEDPALQLFHQEQQELMEQVGQALTALINTPSLTEFQRLRRSIRLIHQGAVQMELDAIARHTTQLLDILHPDVTSPGERLSSAQIETLTKLFRELQQVPRSAPSSVPHPQAGLSGAPSEPSLEEFHESDDFSGSARKISKTGSSLEVSSDIRQILLQNDIAEAIAQLEHSLSNLSGTALIAEVTTKVDALVGWAEVLDWADLGTLASTLIQGINAHPNATASIAGVGVLGLKALHTTALTSLRLATGTQPDPASAPAQHQDNRVPPPYKFATAKKFIWQSQQAIFVVDSVAIAETLVPQPSQIRSRGDQRRLQWRNQRLTIVSLKHKLAQQNSPAIGQRTIDNAVNSGNFTANPVLVIRTATETVALEIEPDQFIRTPTLTVTPNLEFPDFCLGTTSLDQQSNFPVIDVLALLATKSRPSRPPVTTEAATTKSSSGLQVKPPPQSPATPHILVVDDSRTIRYLLQQVFERSGYRVTQAADGLEAIQQLQKHPDIALMVSDVEMPNLTGFELLSRCRRDRQWQTLPIIILSQCPTDQDSQLSQQFGADAYLPKPFNHDVFLGTVKSLLDAKPQTS